MAQQKQFWPPMNPAPCHPPVWEQLTEDERTSVRRQLAQLIRKAVQSPRTRDPKENPHDA